jgi:hypothetical protein
MSEQTTPSPAEQQKMLEEAKQKFEVAKGQMDRQATKAKESWSSRVAQLQLEIEETKVLQAAVDQKKAELEPHRERADVLDYYARMHLLTMINANLIIMKEREVLAYQTSIALTDAIGPLDTDPPPAVPHFPAPSEDMAFLEAQARFDVATLAYHWLRNREGFETILRAGGHEPVLTGDEVQEAARTARVAEVRALTTTDKDFAILLGKLGADLNEARALLHWAQSSLQTIGQLPDEPRRKALHDTDWAKLNGAVQSTLAIPDRVAAYAPLAEQFAEPEFQSAPAG